ncbi:PfkB family carbohydrate kinase [Rhizomonospora bruguierae]|uniref:PfkB family carbohydrate kinase n=1 Tax=Rhizomonospora bruguierae TaxID=1581705 RepID=UPI001BD15863|nr:PfkB family carbohydrate kinase [Micromonospora sp. NBRC 107566]
MSGPLVVIGDVLLDRDVDGTVDRLCPDAPAPVLAERSSVDRPGGAGLAALLAAGRGHDVALVTTLGDDEPAVRLRELLAAAGVQVCALPTRRPTAEKIRLRANGRVLVRLDRGGDGSAAPRRVPAHVIELLRSASAVLVSDYGRGTARSEPLRAALADPAVPVVWDPHPRGPEPTPGARLVTPNEAELRRLTDADGGLRLAAAARGAAELRRRWRAGAVAVTMGADGVLLSHAGPTPLVVPTPFRATGDACGAGDRFASAAAVALAGGALVSEAVEGAVTEATDFVAVGGAAAVRVDASAAERAEDRPDDAADLVERVRARGGTVVATGGCFDLVHAGHVATLEAARQLGDCLVVCLNSDASVAALKGPERPVVPQADRVRLLAALGCVDAVVVFDESTPHAVLSRLRPDVWVKGGDYSGGSPSDTPDLPEAELVAGWGGQTVIVPYLAGRSTTKIIASVKE